MLVDAIIIRFNNLIFKMKKLNDRTKKALSLVIALVVMGVIFALGAQSDQFQGYFRFKYISQSSQPSIEIDVPAVVDPDICVGRDGVSNWTRSDNQIPFNAECATAVIRVKTNKALEDARIKLVRSRSPRHPVEDFEVLYDFNIDTRVGQTLTVAWDGITCGNYSSVVPTPYNPYLQEQQLNYFVGSPKVCSPGTYFVYVDGYIDGRRTNKIKRFTLSSYPRSQINSNRGNYLRIAHPSVVNNVGCVGEARETRDNVNLSRNTSCKSGEFEFTAGEQDIFSPEVVIKNNQTKQIVAAYRWDRGLVGISDGETESVSIDGVDCGRYVTSGDWYRKVETVACQPGLHSVEFDGTVRGAGRVSATTYFELENTINLPVFDFGF